MGDAKYMRSILVSVEQSAKYYEELTFLLYDWGYETSQVKLLSSLPGVEIIPWKNRLINAERLFQKITPFKTYIKKNLLRQPDYSVLKNRWQRELLLIKNMTRVIAFILEWIKEMNILNIRRQPPESYQSQTKPYLGDHPASIKEYFKI